MSEQAWDRRPAAVIEREQGKLLAEWLRREVRPFSRFWGERLRGLEVRGLEDLRALPVVEESELTATGGPGNPGLLLLPTEDEFKRHASRADLRAAAREVSGRAVQARRAALLRRYKPVHVHDAGIGALLLVAYTRTDLDRLHLAGARLAEVLGLNGDDALVNAVPTGPSVQFWGLYHAALAKRMTALHPRGAGEDPVRPVAKALALLPATVLAAPVDEAERLLVGLAERGVDAGSLRTVLVFGPPPSSPERTMIAAAAAALSGGDVRVQAVWAPSSARALWGECRPVDDDPPEATYGLHTYPDLEIVEVREVGTGASAGQAEEGELVYTSLGWRGSVVIRLATGAWTGGLMKVPCPACGRTVPRLAPAARDGAWQPRVSSGGRTVRVDLRRAMLALQPATLSQLGVRDWSLRVVDGRLVLGLDVAVGEDAVGAQLARAIGGTVGVVPEVRLDARVAAVRPQLGNAGVEPGTQPGAEW